MNEPLHKEQTQITVHICVYVYVHRYYCNWLEHVDKTVNSMCAYYISINYNG